MTLGVSVADIVEKSNNPLLAIHPSWQRVLLGDIAEIQNGFAFESSKFSKDKGFPLLRIRDIGENKTQAFYAGNYDESYIVNKGDLVIGMDGDFNCAKWAGEPALLNQRVCKVKLKSSNYNPNFLYYVLPGYLKAINDHTSSVTVKHLSSRTVLEIPLPFPPLPDQERIVARIEELFTQLDAGTSALAKVQAGLRRYKASVLKAAFEGKLQTNNECDEPASDLLKRVMNYRRTQWEENIRAKGKDPKKVSYDELQLSGTEELTELPKNWQWVTWEMVLANENGAFRRGPFGSTLKKSIFVKSGYKVYEQYCAINDDCSFGRYYITPELFEELKSFEVKPGDYLISCSGVTLGRITRVPEKSEKGIINQALLRVRINENIIDHRYFVHFFRSPFFQKKLFDNSTGTAIPNVKGVKELKALPFPLPPLEEQHRIVAEVERRLSVARQVESTVEEVLVRAAKLRQSILKHAFEGKLS